jgi:cytochrome c-type biogenesis protein CcmH
MTMLRVFISMLLLLVAVSFAHAVQPDEMLKDLALEARARSLSAGLRCLVCQNQSIDESEASVAKDLRVLIRDQLTQGKSDSEIVDYLVSRYGDYVLLKPRFSPANYLLWAMPFALLLAGIALAYRRPHKASPESDTLTASEKAELDAVLRK